MKMLLLFLSLAKSCGQAKERSNERRKGLSVKSGVLFFAKSKSGKELAKVI